MDSLQTITVDWISSLKIVKHVIYADTGFNSILDYLPNLDYTFGGFTVPDEIELQV